MGGEGEWRPRPQDTSYFLEYFQPIVVGDVIDAVKREQNKVEAVIRKRAEISSIFARDVCRGILSFRNFNTRRCVIDAGVILAYLKQEPGGAPAANADVQKLFAFDGWKEILENDSFRLMDEVEFVIPAHDFRASVRALVNRVQNVRLFCHSLVSQLLSAGGLLTTNN